MFKEGIKWYITIVIIAFLIFGLVIALNLAGLIILPGFLKLERSAYKSSFQYTEAKNTELLNEITDYNDLETKKQEYIVSNNPAYSGLVDNIENQQKAIADKIRNDADLVRDKNELPSSVKQFLIDHPR